MHSTRHIPGHNVWKGRIILILRDFSPVLTGKDIIQPLTFQDPPISRKADKDVSFMIGLAMCFVPLKNVKE